MTKSPKPDEMSPLVEALAQIKYDEDLNSKKDLAISYKDDGNNNFKLKKYHWAIDCYSKGLSIGCDDPEVNASLYNNRSSSHFFLGNYRSALNDGLKALELNPDYKKAAIRVAQCYFKTNRFDSCIEFCKKSSFREDLKEWEENSQLEKKKIERDTRKLRCSEKKIMEERSKIIEAVTSQGLKYKGSLFDTVYPEAVDCLVHLNDKGELVWPVAIVYPRKNNADFIREFTENDTFKKHLGYLLPGDDNHPEWDPNKEYRCCNVKLCFSEEGTDKQIFLDLNTTLREALRHKSYIIDSSVPVFFVIGEKVD